MARVTLIAVLVVLLNVFVGCHSANKGRSQLKSPRAETVAMVEVSSAAETDIIEQVAINRRAYQQALQGLVDHYTNTGNNMKLQWAKKELEALNEMPQYNYVIEASVAGPDLKASTSIPEADVLYEDAVQLEKEAKKLLIVKDSSLLRLALDKYNRLISKHPASDKIDDAAFNAGEIYEHFKDYSIAVVYFTRAFQWDPATPYPARFKAASILDKKLQRRSEALELYRQAVETEGKLEKHRSWKKYATDRIGVLSKTAEPAREHTKPIM